MMRRRPLSPAERHYAREIFAAAIDYEAITVARGSVFSLFSATTIGNRVNLRKEHFEHDTLELSDRGLLVLIHELAHIWQFQQRGPSYITSSLGAQIAAWAKTGSRLNAYDRRDALARDLPWSQWNAEQQAQIFSDFNEALRRTTIPSATEQDHETVAISRPIIHQALFGARTATVQR